MKRVVFCARFRRAWLIGWAMPCCLAADVKIPDGFTHVRTEQGISEYRLDANGLTVLLLPGSFGAGGDDDGHLSRRLAE